MSKVTISYSKKICNISDMQLSLTQMGVLEEALQLIAETTPDDQLDDINGLVSHFGFDPSEIFPKNINSNQSAPLSSSTSNAELPSRYDEDEEHDVGN